MLSCRSMTATYGVAVIFLGQKVGQGNRTLLGGICIDFEILRLEFISRGKAVSS
jgi:hypothetical protein